MPNTFTLIASSTVGAGGASSISFSSIPSTYTDLCLKISLRGSFSAVADNIQLNINSKGANTGITNKTLFGNGASVVGNSSDLMVYTANTATASVFGNGELYFPNYTSSNNKSISADTVSENNATTAYAFLNAILWSYTETISSIALTPAGGGTWQQYSTAYLYGVIKS